MLNELALTRIVKEAKAEGINLEIARRIASLAAKEAVAGYIEAQVRLLIAKLRQLEKYRDLMDERYRSDPNSPIKQHAFNVASGRIDQILLDINMIQGIGEKVNIAGWKLVPVEPTDKMLREANARSLDPDVLFDDTEFACERAVYAAMLEEIPEFPDDPHPVSPEELHRMD